MIAALREGHSQRAVARQFGVSLGTVQHWADRAGARSLEEVDWSDLPTGPRQSLRRTRPEIEKLVVQLRQELRDSVLGDCGAAAIWQALLARGISDVPAERTIHRILERWALLDRQRRVRHRPPPRGWYLPDVADGRAELDAFDLVEGLRLQDGPLVDVLNAISLHGGLVNAWPRAGFSAQDVRNSLVEHWQAFGRPHYAQFDNDTRFQGPHQHADALGSVIRLCLALQVVPVFVPVGEVGFQAGIESFNGRWQARVWARYHHESLAVLQQRSAKYVEAYRQRSHVRQENAPPRRTFPEGWQYDPQASLQGRIVFLRRTNDAGQVRLLAHDFAVDAGWAHRLVRCDVLLDEHVIRFHALRRRAPEEQPLLNEVNYTPPKRRFRE